MTTSRMSLRSSSSSSRSTPVKSLKTPNPRKGKSFKKDADHMDPVDIMTMIDPESFDEIENDSEDDLSKSQMAKKPKLSAKARGKQRQSLQVNQSQKNTKGSDVMSVDSDSSWNDSQESSSEPSDTEFEDEEESPRVAPVKVNMQVNLQPIQELAVPEIPIIEIVDDDAEESVNEEAPPTTTAATTTTTAAPRRRRVSKKRDQKAEIYEHHPELVSVWDDLERETKVIEVRRAEQPVDVNIKLLPFQLEGLYWLQNQESSRFNGGILADEMGMGKTIQMISLLVTKKDESPSLIVCPTVAILQWMQELKTRTTKDLLNVLVFHGTNRPASVKELLSYDAVVSTYAIIEQGYRKQTYGVKRRGELVRERSVLHSIEWGRVILDEAHAIKDRSCSTARAVFALRRKKQWAMTGTPLQNRVGELYSLIRFMNADPFSYYFCKRCPCKMQVWAFKDRMHCDCCGHTSHQHFCWWNAEILKPIQNNGAIGDGLEAFQKLGILLDRMMLRRTKLERSDEMGLPPRIVTVRRDVFNEAEEELYESLYTDSQRTFSTYVAENTVLNHYASIFSLLSRMRLAVNHPGMFISFLFQDLVTTKLALQNNTAKETLVCGICHEEAEDPILSKCKHVFCREDATQFLQSAPDGEHLTCPLCFKPFTIDLSQPEVERKNASEGVKNSIVNYIDLSKWRSSTKVEALVEELTALQKENSTEKAIVFSQFVAFLDLIQWRLSRAGFNVVKLDGRMAPQQRDTAIKMFMTDPSVTVFLISLKAGGVALNLTEASRCYVMDPWWNPACEDQAFDRIHRLGQYRPIKITRMIIENSIESRILQLQEKKKALFDSTVGKDMSALAQLSEEDLQFLFVL